MSNINHSATLEVPSVKQSHKEKAVLYKKLEPIKSLRSQCKKTNTQNKSKILPTKELSLAVNKKETKLDKEIEPLTTSQQKTILTKQVSTKPLRNQNRNEEVKQYIKSIITPKTGFVERQITNEEKEVYGNRFPIGYKKIALLGKGGCAVVWLANELNTNTKVAIKQFSKASGHQNIESAKVEMEISKLIFNGEEHPGVKYIVRLLNKIEDKKDIWLIYETGGSSLTQVLFDIKGEFYKGERIYKVTHKDFYNKLKDNPKLLYTLIKQLLQVLSLLQEHNIIHCDLKPDNILITLEGEEVNIKVIDFGSAFIHKQDVSFRMGTPEYMPPECLSLMKATAEDLISLGQKTHSWSVDMWSLGAVLLEIFTGFPQWLSLKGRVEGYIGYGVFAVKGKEEMKIMQKQREVVKNLSNVLKSYSSFIENEEIINLLGRMLKLNPLNRISPEEALSFSIFNNCS